MHHRITSSRWLAVSASTLLILIGLGCASPGPPLPPSLHLPRIVNDLTAERIGDAVNLKWTTPSRTTDDLEIKGTVVAEICRQIHSAQLQHPPSPDCVTIKKIPVHPGPTQAADVLPSALAGDPVELLAYRVRLYNANDRTAGPSSPAYAVSGAAPPSVDDLRATSTRSGILLEWKQEPSAIPVDLARTLIPAQTQHSPAKVAMPASTPKPKSSRTLNLAPATPAEIDLQAGAQSIDPGGATDTTAQKDQTYRYTAQRVRSVVLFGHSLELRSLPSKSVTVTLRDIFAPASPAGLAAIPGEAGKANHSIDLSWEPVADTDLAGYIVYRQQITPSTTAAGSFERISTALIAGPAFSDKTAVPGHTYAYRVTAIDTAGNESAPGASVQQTLSEP